MALFDLFQSQAFQIVFRTIINVLPFIAPAALLKVFWTVWINYRRLKFFRTKDFHLLEIKLPRDVYKSPAAMEVALVSLFQTGTGSHFEFLWEGKARPWFTLEIASFGGDIHFYVWVGWKYKDAITSQIYSQYPDVEIEEVFDDYALKFQWNPETHFMWGTYFKLQDSDVYPIVTYVDYGLDKDPKEELKIDPLAGMLEFMGSVKPGEQVWMQILIQAHYKTSWAEGDVFFKKKDWIEDAEKEIKKIKDDATPEAPDAAAYRSFPLLDATQQKKIESLKRSVGKFAFKTMIRSMYISRWETFNNGNVTGLIGSVRQFSSPDGNNIKLGWYTDWADTTKTFLSLIPRGYKMFQWTRDHMEKHMLDAYKKRSFFHPPYKFHHAKPFIMNVEELATLYHFPGSVAGTPTLSRADSRKAEPPTDLPV